jgi:hypothetical protein
MYRSFFISAFFYFYFVFFECNSTTYRPGINNETTFWIPLQATPLGNGIFEVSYKHDVEKMGHYVANAFIATRNKKIIFFFQNMKSLLFINFLK